MPVVGGWWSRQKGSGKDEQQGQGLKGTSWRSHAHPCLVQRGGREMHKVPCHVFTAGNLVIEDVLK
jgi:hypothetical protein